MGLTLWRNKRHKCDQESGVAHQKLTFIDVDVLVTNVKNLVREGDDIKFHEWGKQ